MSKKPIIEIWSTYPPPYGGVSVHSMRLFERLKDQNEIKLIFKNFNGSRDDPGNQIFKVHYFFLEFLSLFVSRNKRVHLHSNNIKLWILLGLFARHHKFILTIHNQRIRNIKNRFQKVLIRFFLKNVKHIILNDKYLSQYIAATYAIDIEKFKILPAFIPPLPFEESGLDSNIYYFRKQFNFLISTSAWKLYRKNKIDVYGIKQIIYTLSNLVSKGYSIGLIMVMPIIEDTDYFKELALDIDQLNLRQNILIISEPLPNAFEIWKLSDVYVRATNTDIEGLTIKEALYYNTPVVASDIVIRPKEVILYRYNNINDMTEKIINAFSSDKSEYTFQEENTCTQIHSLYKSI